VKFEARDDQLPATHKPERDGLFENFDQKILNVLVENTKESDTRNHL
jgi:hypothetical protein